MTADDRRTLWRDLVLLFVLQVVALTAFRLVLPDGAAANEGSDFDAFYRPVAEQIADGRGIELDGEPATRYPPGYPLVLGGAFVLADVVGLPRSDAVAPLTIVLAAVAGVLLHVVARRLLGRRHAWVTSAVWLLYPLTLWTTKQPNSEVPFLVGLYAAIAVLAPLLVSGRAGPRRLAAVGLLLGLSAIVRPAGLVLIPAVAVVAWLRLTDDRRRRTALAAVLLVAAAVPVLTVSAWTSAQRDQVALLSDSNAANLVEGLSFAIDDPAEADDLAMPGGLRDFVLEAHAREGELLREGSAPALLRTTARERPVVLVELLVYKAARAWYGTESFRYEGLLLATQVVWLGLAAAGAWRRRGDEAVRWFVALVVALNLGAWAAAIVGLSIVRYLVPTAGLLAPLVAAALVAAARVLRPARARGTGPRPAPA